VAWDVVTGDGGVGADDLFLDCDAGSFGVGDGEGRGDGDVLAYGEAEDGGRGWEGEAVAVGSLEAVTLCRERGLTLPRCERLLSSL